MSLKTAKTLIAVMLALSVVCCVAGIILSSQGSSDATPAILAVVLMFLVIGVDLKFCRCPWCGKTLFVKLFSLKVCPQCGRDLETGRKKKGKGGKR